MQIKAKDLTRGRILPQLLNLSLPIMAGSFIQMAYNLINMAWVGRLGSQYLAAVGAVGMLMWFSSSAAYLAKIGAEVSVSHALGAKNYRQARSLASHTTTLALLTGLAAASVLFFGSDLIISFFKLDNDISRTASQFLRIIIISIPLLFLNLNFSGIYNASGRSKVPFAITACGLVCNMILDPLLIFVFKYGIDGAAFATIVSQLFVTIVFIFRLKSRKGVFDHFRFFIFPQRQSMLKIIKLGFPVAIMNMFYAGVNMCLARTASLYGGYIGVTSQTTGGQIEGIDWNTSQGFSTALGAFVSMNYGAGKTDRIKNAYRYTLMILLSFGILVSLSFIFFGKNIFEIFIPEPKAAIEGGNYLRIMGFSQIFMMLELSSQGMFNGIGKTLPPALVSMSLNALRIPLAMFLASRIGLSGVWWAISISSILKGGVLPLWFLFLYKKKIGNI